MFYQSLVPMISWFFVIAVLVVAYESGSEMCFCIVWLSLGGSKQNGHKGDAYVSADEGWCSCWQACGCQSWRDQETGQLLCPVHSPLHRLAFADRINLCTFRGCEIPCLMFGEICLINAGSWLMPCGYDLIPANLENVLSHRFSDAFHWRIWELC